MTSIEFDEIVRPANWMDNQSSPPEGAGSTSNSLFPLAKVRLKSELGVTGTGGRVAIDPSCRSQILCAQSFQTPYPMARQGPRVPSPVGRIAVLVQHRGVMLRSFGRRVLQRMDSCLPRGRQRDMGMSGCRTVESGAHKRQHCTSRKKSWDRSKKGSAPRQENKKSGWPFGVTMVMQFFYCGDPRFYRVQSQ